MKLANNLDASLVGVLFAGGAFGLSWAFKWFARTSEQHQGMLRDARTDLSQAEQKLRADLVDALEQCRMEVHQLREELHASYARIAMLESYRSEYIKAEEEHKKSQSHE